METLVRYCCLLGSTARKTFLKFAVELAVDKIHLCQLKTEMLVPLDQQFALGLKKEKGEVEGCRWEEAFVLDEEGKMVMAFVFCDGEEREEEWVKTVLEDKEGGRRMVLVLIEDEEERKGLSVVEEEEGEKERKVLGMQQERDLYGRW